MNEQPEYQTLNIENLQIELSDALDRLESERAIQIIELLPRPFPSSIREEVAWAYAMTADIMIAQAKMYTGAEAAMFLSQACDYCQLALKVKPDLYTAFDYWGRALTAWAQLEAGVQRNDLWLSAQEKYRQCLLLEPKQHGVLLRWADVLVEQARAQTAPESNHYWQAACQKYQEAMLLETETWLFGALARLEKAITGQFAAIFAQMKGKSDEEVENLLSQEFEQYQQTLANIQKTSAVANMFLAFLLYQRAWRKGDGTSDVLWRQAYAKFAEATHIDPRLYRGFRFWGKALAEQAKAKAGAEADQLRLEACQKYQKAIEIEFYFYEAWYEWGHVILIRAEDKQNSAERRALLEDAYAIFLSVHQLEPTDTYDLAYLAALLDQPDECRRWLEHCLMQGTLADCQQLTTDPDFASVRSLPWFTDLLRRAGCVS
jgi:hypothetical protein